VADTYRKQIKLVVEACREAVQKERDALALEIVDQLVTRPPVGTPVATGWCRANWLPALSQPARGPSMRGKGGATEGDAARAGAAQQAAIASLLMYGPQRPRDPAFVSNGTDYVNALNQGHSRQNTAGWVERCVETAVGLRSQAQRVTIRRV
jgi:hypothetical protein